MYKPKTNTSIVPKQAVVLLLAVIFSLSIVLATNPDTQYVKGTSATELQSVIDSLAAQQEANEEILEDLSAKVNSLQNRLAILQTEINQINTAIEKTELEIKKLTIELQLAEKELIRQKGILAENLRTLYIEGGVSTLDLILASDSFSDFINRQEYLARLKNSVQDSTERVILLKEEIEKNKKEQEELLAKQERQKRGLNDSKAVQQALLNATKGQETRYQQIVVDLEKQHEQAIQALEDYLVNQTFTSQGPVDRGDVIGFMGLTGYTTGVHLHFGVRQGGQTGDWIDPQISGTKLVNNYLWPTESTRITAGFGASGCGEYVCGGTHFGLDVGAVDMGVQGDLVFAVDDGEILHRGFLPGSGLGYFVIIDHGNDWTYYGHLQS
jgi:peptidoglycan hydrolase CwlO-like protein